MPLHDHLTDRNPSGFRVGLMAFALSAGALFAPDALADDDHEGDHELVQYLMRTGLDPDGIAKAEWEDEGDEAEFEVELSLMDAGDYELWVGGVLRGSIPVGLDGMGQIEFENNDDEGDDGDESPLDFDPIDQLIEVRQGAEVFFSDVFAPGAVGAGSSEDEEIEIEVYLVNVATDLDFDARGRMKLEQEDGGAETEFDVEVEDLDGGLYDLRVGGAVVASFDSTGFEEVELEFHDPFGGDAGDSDDDEDELELHLALDFDPLGQLVEIVRQVGGQVILAAMLPASAGMSGGDAYAHGNQWAKDKGKKQADKLLIKLQSTGHMPGAKGKAVFEIEDEGGPGAEQELEVEIEDVGDGSFDVCLDGALVGSILTSGGEGELKLSSEPESGEELLSVPVRGALLEVKAAGMVVLTSQFPVSVPDAIGKYKPEKTKFFPGTSDPKRLTRNLRNALVDLDTLGTVDWKQKDAGVKLTVKFTDLPDGDYGLWLDGVEVAEIEVQNGKGKAKFFEWLDAPTGSAAPLDFDVLGGLLEVRDDDGAVQLRAGVD